MERSALGGQRPCKPQDWVAIQRAGAMPRQRSAPWIAKRSEEERFWSVDRGAHWEGAASASGRRDRIGWEWFLLWQNYQTAPEGCGLK
ncbi:unnamed protein product [Linum trigynum]|uniref:Uncharacterized protein n=1 Tax=Linum trigynum TaxID=586398 RepID=A0AAV2EZ43_9ROSI